MNFTKLIHIFPFWICVLKPVELPVPTCKDSYSLGFSTQLPFLILFCLYKLY